MKNAISKFLKYGTLISTYALILSVLVQIFARFFLPNAPAWTEEASRLFFIYAVAFSAGLAFESQEYIALDWLFEKFSSKTQTYLKIAIAGLTFVLFAIMAFYALQFVFLGHQETAPGMKIRMSYIFFSMFVLAASLSYFVGVSVYKNVQSK